LDADGCVPDADGRVLHAEGRVLDADGCVPETVRRTINVGNISNGPFHE
jgi:hypothetical protein